MSFDNSVPVSWIVACVGIHQGRLPNFSECYNMLTVFCVDNNWFVIVSDDIQL